MTPLDHAVALYEAAQGPKKLIIQRHTTHYASYERYRDRLIPQIVDWMDRHVRRQELVTLEERGSEVA